MGYTSIDISKWPTESSENSKAFFPKKQHRSAGTVVGTSILELRFPMRKHYYHHYHRTDDQNNVSVITCKNKKRRKRRGEGGSERAAVTAAAAAI